jgi:DNA-binding phage protein
MDIEKALLQAVRRDERSQYRLAKDAGLAVAVLQRFVSGERSITLGTASKLCKALGLELRPAKRNK